MSIKSNALRQAARGQKCTFAIAGVCNNDNSTTVLAHLPDESGGMGKKSDDISGAFACSACHDVIDGRVSNAEYKAGKCYYNFRAFKRTLRKWIEMDLIAVKGLK